VTAPAILPARSAKDLHDAAALFAAYAAWLPIDLDYQGFGDELAGLPGKYAPPGGELLLARDGAGVALGCVGMRPLPEAGCCEMKRLYLKPDARGSGLGRALAESIVRIARERGYREMRLDTLASMTGPIALYDRMGFVRIDAYYAPTPEGTMFMGLAL
jgi:GNAT superfamily N-acetyltransferase